MFNSRCPEKTGQTHKIYSIVFIARDESFNTSVQLDFGVFVELCFALFLDSGFRIPDSGFEGCPISQTFLDAFLLTVTLHFALMQI